MSILICEISLNLGHVFLYLFLSFLKVNQGEDNRQNLKHLKNLTRLKNLKDDDDHNNNNNNNNNNHNNGLLLWFVNSFQINVEVVF